MKNLIKINKYFGWILIIGFVITQLFITKTTLEMGRMAPFIAILTGVFFLPFLVSAVISVLNREKHSAIIKIGIKICLLFQTTLPLALPLFFDKELAYFSLLGLSLAIILWFYKKKLEVQLIILNCFGALVLSFVMLAALLNYY